MYLQNNGFVAKPLTVRDPESQKASSEVWIDFGQAGIQQQTWPVVDPASIDSLIRGGVPSPFVVLESLKPRSPVDTTRDATGGLIKIPRQESMLHIAGTWGNALHFSH